MRNVIACHDMAKGGIHMFMSEKYRVYTYRAVKGVSVEPQGIYGQYGSPTGSLTQIVAFHHNYVIVLTIELIWDEILLYNL